jgi:hypothetical protein
VGLPEDGLDDWRNAPPVRPLDPTVP